MNWQEIIRDYNLNHRRGNKDQLTRFREQPSFKDALLKAAKAENERGKRYRHQNKVWKTAIPEAQHRLLKAADRLQECKSFHELWLLLYTLLKPTNGPTTPVKGIGHLYIYDTALRLGSYLDLTPEKVYLHAGTLEGAQKFGFISGSKAWLELGELPEDLQRLSANEVEDILCIYKDKNVRAGGCLLRKQIQC